MEIIIILATVVITWLFVHEYLYSPKAYIRRLWKEVFVILRRSNDHMKNYNDNGFLEGVYEKELQKRYKIINALLDYYFDPEEDSEYIEDNRPASKEMGGKWGQEPF